MSEGIHTSSPHTCTDVYTCATLCGIKFQGDVQGNVNSVILSKNSIQYNIFKIDWCKYKMHVVLNMCALISFPSEILSTFKHKKVELVPSIINKDVSASNKSNLSCYKCQCLKYI